MLPAMHGERVDGRFAQKISAGGEMSLLLREQTAPQRKYP
jgi:hypothetical protein